MTTPFSRPNLLIASPQGPVTEALTSFVRLFLGEHLPHRFGGTEDGSAITVSCAEDIHTVLDRIERREIFNTVVIVDLTSSRDIAWEASSSNARPVCGDKSQLRPTELPLRYPEVYWIFLVRSLPKLPVDCQRCRELHFVAIDDLCKLVQLLQRHAQGFRTWFDPTGLRRILCGESPPERFGIAMDEETSFAVLNGYILHRSHYATWVVASHAEMILVLSQKQAGSWAIMEDLELKFGDDDGNVEYLSPKKGRGVLDVLRNRKEAEKFRHVYSRAKRLVVSAIPLPIKNGPKYGSVMKPYGGMFTPELDIVCDVGDRTTHHHYPENDQTSNAHSAPHRMQQIAEAILIRARRLERNARTTEAAVHAALLAHETRHLLQNKTLALSLEALAIQHRMEVTAECAFIGTSSRLEVRRRFVELKRDIQEIVGGKKYRTHQTYNALVEIADDLRQIYRQYDQFQEEEEAINKLRWYEWRLKYASFQPASGTRLFVSRAAFAPKMLFGGIPEGYFNIVLGGFWRIALAMFLWVALFAGLYSKDMCDTKSACHKYEYYADWLRHSAATFFAAQQGTAGDPKFWPENTSLGGESSGVSTAKPSEAPLVGCDSIAGCMASLVKPNESPPDVLTMKDKKSFTRFWNITIAEMILGFIHLGILVSYLFQKIARR